MQLSLSEFAIRCQGQLVGADQPILGFATDHRQVLPGSLFIAIRGERVDGHQFAAEAIERGALGVLSEQTLDVPHIRIQNVVQALADVARSIRKEYSGPVIGITGSAGKTTTKEFIAAACSPLGAVLKTIGNRNSEFTGPLQWTELEPHHSVVVSEMGMRGFGQIAHLASFHLPTVGVITNIGFAHLELVGSREGIAKAKSELLTALPEDGTAILYSEDEYLGNLISAAGERTIRTFGWGGNADCQVTEYRPLSWHQSEIGGVLDGVKWSTTMPTVGRHLATNAAAALLAATTVGVSLQDAAEALQRAELPPLRMDIRRLGEATLVMDNYNSNPPAVLGAIQALEEVPCDGKRWVVLGTMRELGQESEEAHRSIGRRLSKSKVDHIVLFGPETEFVAAEFEKRKGDISKLRFAQSIDEIRSLTSQAQPGDTILVKGSRALEMEKAFE